MPDILLEFELVCACGQQLDAVQSRSSSTRFQVDACEACMTEAFAEGKVQGAEGAMPL